MMKIYPPQSKQFRSIITSFLWTVIFFGFFFSIIISEPLMKNGAINWKPAYIIIFTGLMGLGFAVTCIGTLRWYLSGDPFAVIDSERISIRNLFGKVHSAPWLKIRKISYKEREFVTRRRNVPYQTLDFYVLSEKEQDRISAFLSISQHEIDTPFKEIVAELQKIPAAAAQIDPSCLNMKPDAKKSNVSFIGPVTQTAIALCCGVGFFFYLRSTYKNDNKMLVGPIKTEITCSRHANERASFCLMIERALNGNVLRKRALVDVFAMIVKEDKLPTFYLKTPIQDIPIAAVDLRQVYNGVDSEKTEPLASINKLQHYIDEPQERSITVSY